MNKYKKFNQVTDIEIDISKLEDNIKNVQAKKDKLLELTIKNFLSDEEFYKRNEELNKEIEKYNKEINNLKEEKENVSLIEENMKKIKQTLEKEIKIDENVEDLIKLLVDKIYVSKVDGNRKHIKLEIYFKIGEPITLENNYQSCNNDIYNCSRK